MTPPPAVVVASGHMVDAPHRAEPRFPQGEVDRVRDEVRRTLSDWGVGPETTVVSGGARGADLIVAEEGQALGARVVLCLAEPPEEFERTSVALPDTDWADRFRKLLASAEVRVLTDERPAPGGDERYAATNNWMIDVARSLVPDGEDGPNAIIVWDGQGGDGPGGTRDFVHQLGYDERDPRVRVIDPTP